MMKGSEGFEFEKWLDQAMDKETIERVKKTLVDASEKNEIELEEVIVFGSRAREDYRKDSDIDLLIVSSGFEGVQWNKRSRTFYLEWDYDEMPEPEFICLTPEEFEDKKDREPHIVNTAVAEGVSI